MAAFLMGTLAIYTPPCVFLLLFFFSFDVLIFVLVALRTGTGLGGGEVLGATEF